MKYERGVSVLGFNAELILESRDGRTHSLMCDCPEDMNYIMDVISDSVAKKLAAYMEHLREGHGDESIPAKFAVCNDASDSGEISCTRRLHHKGKHRFGSQEWE
jgi:hypothetical protein